jgi:hypothetical protein
VRVRVEDFDVFGQLATKFLVPLRHQLLSAPECLVHNDESMSVGIGSAPCPTF